MMVTYKWKEDKADYSDKIITRSNDYLFMWHIKELSWGEVIYVTIWKDMKESKWYLI